ncbi:MAG TPA: hypothetical protein VFA67_00790 [Candidatus Sulfotelmatobacter sp.]|nr:hypothetical protein [Candidatus Sulfotelmatobacter sp.]
MSRLLWCSQALWASMLALGLPFSSVGQTVDPGPKSTPNLAPQLYLKVQLSHAPNFSRLKAGDVVEGSLSRDVYSAGQKLFSAGSAIRLTVDDLEKKPRPADDHWPWIVQVVAPRRITSPTVHHATILQDQREVPLDVSLLSLSRMREVRADKPRYKIAEAANPTSTQPRLQKNKPVTIMVLEAQKIGASIVPSYHPVDDADTNGNPPVLESIPAGTRCRLLLLNPVSASRSHPGDEFAASLLEPLILNAKIVLPAGTVFTGKVAKKTPPRRLSRPASLRLVFSEITLPQGVRLPVTASLAAAELDPKSHTRIDSEGEFHGEHPGKAWMAINLGVSAGIAKGVDDGAQLLLEALISTATDVSTAGAARIASTCATGLYMATRHGRDVILPRFTEIEVSLDRPLTLAPPRMQVAMASTSIENTTEK